MLASDCRGHVSGRLNVVLAEISTKSEKKTISSNYTIVEAWEKSGRIDENYYKYLGYGRGYLCVKGRENDHIMQ
jgi:hypothetical protein